MDLRSEGFISLEMAATNAVIRRRFIGVLMLVPSWAPTRRP